MESSCRTQKRNKRPNKISKKNKLPIPIRTLYEYQSDFEKLRKQLKEGKINEVAFEELSTQLLLKIDAVETNGDVKIRELRKKLIVFINNFLEEK